MSSARCSRTVERPTCSSKVIDGEEKASVAALSNLRGTRHRGPLPRRAQSTPTFDAHIITTGADSYRPRTIKLIRSPKNGPPPHAWVGQIR